MDIVRLQYFIEVAKYLNFSEASKYLFVSQSTISKQIALLEEELGVKLFFRDKRSVQLTPAGLVFLEKVEGLLKQYNEAVTATRNANKGVIGTLNIGVISYMEFLPAFLKYFQKTYPSIELNLTHLNPASIVDSITNKELDVGFTVSLGIQNFPNLLWEPYHTDQMNILVNNDHHLATYKKVHISLLVKENFVLMSRSAVPESYEKLVRICEGEGFQPKISYESARLETLYLLVESGMAISVLPKVIGFIKNRNHKMIPLEGDHTTYEQGIFIHKDQTNPSLRIFLEEFRRFSFLKADEPNLSAK